MKEKTSFRGETPADLVYDDEPIEAILYGSAPDAATPAGIFAPARNFLGELTSWEHAPDLNAVLRKCRRFIDDGNPLTLELFSRLFEIVILATASETLPATAEMKEQLSGLLKLLWRQEVKWQLSPKMMQAGWTYWNWCVQRRNIEEAREILASLYRAAGLYRQETTKLARLRAEQLALGGDSESARIVHSMVRDFEEE